MRLPLSRSLAALIAATVTLLNLVVFIGSAEAINVKFAKVQKGFAVVRGNKAIPHSDIFWEGAKVTQADKRGHFSFSGVVPANCVGAVSDGIPVAVVVLNCKPVAVSPVPTTGQTLCYAADGSAIIPCAGTGQDGEFQNGLPWPVARFTDNSDGTITDNLTGLTWLKDANCFGQITWSQALSSAGALSNGACNLTDGSVAGDWRVPNIRELQSLVDYGAPTQPALPAGHPFVNLGQTVGLDYPYWTSNTNATSWSVGFVINFGPGSLIGSAKGNANFLWPVRDSF
jgi:hypothetical protein